MVKDDDLGFDMSASAFALVKAMQGSLMIDDSLRELEGVSEAFAVAGTDYSYLLKITANNNEEIGRIARQIALVEGVAACDLSIVIGTVKKPDSFPDPTVRMLRAVAHPVVQKPYERFLSQLLIRGKERNRLHAMMRLFGRPYTGAPSKLSGAKYWYYIARVWSRAELYIDRLDAKENKAIFDQLLARKMGIENAFGDQLYWQRLDDKRACRISFRIPGGYNDSDSSWPDTQDRLSDVMIRLEAALSPQLENIQVRV